MKAKLLITLILSLPMLTIAQTNWGFQNSGSTQVYSDVYFENIITGWTVGENGIILNTSNGGNTWANQISGARGKQIQLKNFKVKVEVVKEEITDIIKKL